MNFADRHFGSWEEKHCSDGCILTFINSTGLLYSPWPISLLHFTPAGTRMTTADKIISKTCSCDKRVLSAHIWPATIFLSQFPSFEGLCGLWEIVVQSHNAQEVKIKVWNFPFLLLNILTISQGYWLAILVGLQKWTIDGPLACAFQYIKQQNCFQHR